MSKNFTLNITRRALIRGSLSIVMLVYLIVAVVLTRGAVADSEVKSVNIIINDSLGTHFIEAQDIKNAIPALSAAKVKRSSINTLNIEHTLLKMESVEAAKCVFLNDHSLRITVTPMIPVARVFPDHGVSYYINREGKKITADRAHHVNVPVVTGNITDPEQVVMMLPMLEKISQSPKYDALVTAVSRSARGDIIIIPVISGHVINMGDTTEIDNKFQRLTTFYDKVMKVKGWNFYDTISVKWRGRVVASRRTSKVVEEPDNIVYDEDVDDETMTTGIENDTAVIVDNKSKQTDNKTLSPQQ